MYLVLCQRNQREWQPQRRCELAVNAGDLCGLLEFCSFPDSHFLGRCDDVCKDPDPPVPLSESRDAAEEVQGKRFTCFALTKNWCAQKRWEFISVSSWEGGVKSAGLCSSSACCLWTWCAIHTSLVQVHVTGEQSWLDCAPEVQPFSKTCSTWVIKLCHVK